MAALDYAVRSGKALYVGISSYSPEQTREAARILKDLGTPCLVHQASYNLLDRRVEDGLLGVLEEEGIGAIAFCPLAQGLLTGRYLKDIPADSRAAREEGFLRKERVQTELERIKTLDAVASGRGQTLAQMALSWVLREPRVSSALIGASRVGQLEENLGALGQPDFSAEELAQIDAICRG